ncbi:MAG: hypothetical protein WD031_02695 [Gemmatimonadota bacterium]
MMLGGDAEGGDVPPHSALVTTLLGRKEERRRSLGDYDSASYPVELRELLSRREEVARELLQMGITNAEKRIEAIPRLRELLRIYPHPLAYETLIHAYIDAGRFDEAKGVAFAARQRRLECAGSEHPEIRAEIERLHEWSSEDVEELQRDRAPSKAAP